MRTREQRRAIFASIGARIRNTGRALGTQYKSNRELSESEYRAKYKTRRGAYLGAAAGAGAGLYHYRKNPTVRIGLQQTWNAAKQLGQAAYSAGSFSRPPLRSITPEMKYAGRKLLPVVGAGVVAGAVIRGFANPERIQRIQSRQRVQSAGPIESEFVRVHRI